MHLWLDLHWAEVALPSLLRKDFREINERRQGASASS
jgi:hypothetical protein